MRWRRSLGARASCGARAGDVPIPAPGVPEMARPLGAVARLGVRGVGADGRHRGGADPSPAPRDAPSATLVAPFPALSSPDAPRAPPAPTPVARGTMVSASPRCALADGTTEVDIIARDAPTGDLTCRFVDYAVAEALRDANVAVNATETAYVAADAWASSQGDILGFIPAEAEAANQTAYDEWIAALDAQTEAYADALVATAFAVPVDAVVVSRAADTNGDEITTARCATPAGDGQTLTVGLVNDGGAEGVDSVGAHYPLTPSEVTMLSADVRVRRTALDAVSPTSGPSTGGTSVAMTGKGFESPMTCVFHRDSVATNVVATVVNATHATCVSPHGSSRVDVELVFEDGCSLPFQFQYYNPRSRSSSAPPRARDSAPSTSPSSPPTCSSCSSTPSS